MAHVSLMLESRGWRVTRIPVTPGRMNVFATCVRRAARDAVDASRHRAAVHSAARRWRHALGPRRVRREGHCRGDDPRGGAAARARSPGRAPVRRRRGGHARRRARGQRAARAPVACSSTASPRKASSRSAPRARCASSSAPPARPRTPPIPQLGDSAIAQARRAARASSPSLELPHDELLGATTINIGQIAGGVADNVIAPSAEARLMVRLVSDADEVWRCSRRGWRGARRSSGARWCRAMRLGSVPGFETTVVAFATDIPELTRWGTPYLFGPGSIHVAHTARNASRARSCARRSTDYVRLAEAALATDRPSPALTGRVVRLPARERLHRDRCGGAVSHELAVRRRPLVLRLARRTPLLGVHPHDSRARARRRRRSRCTCRDSPRAGRVGADRSGCSRAGPSTSSSSADMVAVVARLDHLFGVREARTSRDVPRAGG